MLDILAGVETETTATGAEEGHKKEAPYFGSSAIFVLDVSHGELVAGAAHDLDGGAGVAGLGGKVGEMGHAVEVDILVGFHDGAQIVAIVVHDCVGTGQLGVAEAVVLLLLDVVL